MPGGKPSAYARPGTRSSRQAFPTGGLTTVQQQNRAPLPSKKLTLTTEIPTRKDGASHFLQVVYRNGLYLHGDLLGDQELSLADEGEEERLSRLTQVDAARLAGLSRPSVANYAQRMRRTVLSRNALAIRGTTGYAIGVDFGVTHRTRVALSNANGKIVRVLPKEAKLGPQTPSEALEAARREILSLLKQYPEVTESELIGVGIGLPGPVKDGRLIGPEARLWRGRDVAAELQEMLGWEDVSFVTESDTYLSALAETLWEGGKVAKNNLYIKWSGGLRAAIVIQGEPYIGHSGTAGELPHIVADPDRSERCEVCEQPGCLHAIAPLPVISGRIARREGGPTKELLRASQIVARAQDDRSTMAELETAARAIGRAIAPMVDAVDPEAVIIGGALGTRAFPLLSDAFEMAIKNNMARSQIKVTGGLLGHRTAVSGAVALVLERFAPAYLRRVAGI